MIIYGWTKEYLLTKVTLKQFSLYYKEGYKYDMERRGFTFPKTKDETAYMNSDELRNLYYTPEQVEAQKEYLKKQYGGTE